MKNTELKTVTLENPISLGKKEIKEINIRKPMAGDLRGGISVAKIGQYQWDESAKLITRISIDNIPEEKLEELTGKDCVALMDALATFLQ
ncbi:phage tail assembly protein [Kiloniella sp. b19]|uniref:phage tail assembly protein n=1 Tax=Kiloniella sp. GXU_MW_B19 TaxID=3141326 RepID=UPI0031CDEC89